jgi:hypothetical protein
MHLFLHSDGDDRIMSKLAEILNAVRQLETHMANELDELKTKVAASGDATDAAVILLKGLKAKLDAAGTDPVALKELSDSLGTNTDELAAAILENTPAESP